jgi:hypothetical protein
VDSESDLPKTLPLTPLRRMSKAIVLGGRGESNVDVHGGGGGGGEEGWRGLMAGGEGPVAGKGSGPEAEDCPGPDSGGVLSHTYTHSHTHSGTWVREALEQPPVEPVQLWVF